MKIKTILNDLNILHTKCKNVEKIDDEIISTLDEMLNFMYESEGIGLAANQVGILKNMIVIDLQQNKEKSPMFFINCEIIERSEELVEKDEGCLSVPEIRINMKRNAQIKVKYLDKNGKENILTADGLLAICLQHELDHINGVTIFDSLSKIKRIFTLKKIKNLLKNKK